jgi:capsular polysaccharide biosynthesis protein
MSAVWAVVRRRGWIVVVSVIVVAAAVVGLSSLRSSSATAEATLLVPPSFGATTPGAASEATSLATTYTRLIPADAAITAAVAGRLGVSPARVRDAVSVRRNGRTAVLRATYTASTPTAATRGARALARVLTRAIPEDSAVASGSLLLASTPAGKPRRHGRRYAATTEVVVNSGAGPASPANADGATRLARTYAGILADDAAVAAAVAKTLGTTADDVRSNVTVTNDSSTSLLRIDYRAPTKAAAVAGAVAFANAVSAAEPASPNLAPGALEVVRMPSATGTAPGGDGAAGTSASDRKAIAVGIVLGLVLGLILLLARERADRRIDDPGELADELGVPATSLRSLGDDAAGTLLRRWQALDGDRPTTRIALIGAGAAGRSGDPVLDAVADRLATAGRETHIETTVRHAGRDLAAGGDPDGVVVMVPNGSGPENAAMASDLVVLLVDEGARASTVRAASSGLGGLGRAPVWALLAPRGRRRRRRR